jgi:hypothetical protein
VFLIHPGCQLAWIGDRFRPNLEGEKQSFGIFRLHQKPNTVKPSEKDGGLEYRISSWPG